jgi:hypothetical protein
VSRLNDQVNRFWNQASYGMSTFTFETVSGVPNNGWFDLPSSFSSTGVFFVRDPEGDTQSIINEVERVHPTVDLSTYHRLLIIANYIVFGAWTAYWKWLRTATGIESHFVENGVRVGKRRMCITAAFEWVAGPTPFDNAASNIAHELGHQLSLREHYGIITVAGQGVHVNLIDPWSVMAKFRSPPTYPLGWSKYDRGWLRNTFPPRNINRVLMLGPPVGNSIDQIVNLQPHEVLRPSGVQIILVQFTPDPSTLNPPFRGML